MEKDYQTASGKFWQTVWRLRRGKQLSANTVFSGGGELLASTGDIVGGWKEYFEDLLNPTDTPSVEEPEAEDSEIDSFITQAEVTEVVQQLLGGKAPWVDEICPEYLKSLDVVGLSWLTHLCNIAWWSGTVPLDWVTGVVVPLFKKGDRRTSFYKEKLESSVQDPQKLHNIFSSLLNPPAPPAPSSLTAKDFATFYTEKIERICLTFTSAPTSSTSHSQHSATPSLKHLSTVAAEEVLQIIRSCNPTTCPLDPVPSAMLQTISPDLLPFITTVINGSLTSGHVLTVFKKARVIPILKKPALDPSDISNYRPVSLLSFLSKILACIVYNQLSDYLMQNNLHDPNQSGFKAAHSTETAHLAVTEKLHADRSAKLS
ncbi:hypothetical protein QTP86_008636 [Hemibagrus guttatus]|nr:hypothetical protein QTP86_008636 [Hemibagrus guttatus]